MGAGVTGNRVVGASDPGVHSLTVNPQTLELDPNGVKISPAHIHASLRAKFGVDTNPLSAHYPLQEVALPNLFG